MLTNNFLADKFPIEAEVRAETQPQGCTRSHPHENMSAECEAKTVEARRVFWEAQEPVYIVFDGPPSHESGRFIEAETKDGKSVAIGWTQEGEYWRLGPVFLALQPPAPCHLPLEKSHYCPDCEALQANVAELKEKMFSESAEFVHFMQIDHPKALGERDSTIAQQAERIAELETRLEENAMPDDYILMADKLSVQAALIEKCERCLQDLSGMGWADEALAAIAAHRGQS